jgi:phage tail-like protein
MAELPGEKQLRTQSIAAHRFLVEVDGVPLAAFTECTLPAIEWDVEDLKEGGLNVFVHQLPGQRKSARISLKNGVGKSSLMEWYMDAMTEKIVRKPVTVTLLDSLHNPVLAWQIENAYPVKWSGPSLKSDTNAIAIQTLDLACGEITIKAGGA